MLGKLKNHKVKHFRKVTENKNRLDNKKVNNVSQTWAYAVMQLETLKWNDYINKCFLGSCQIKQIFTDHFLFSYNKIRNGSMKT